MTTKQYSKPLNECSDIEIEEYLKQRKNKSTKTYNNISKDTAFKSLFEMESMIFIVPIGKNCDLQITSEIYINSRNLEIEYDLSNATLELNGAEREPIILDLEKSAINNINKLIGILCKKYKVERSYILNLLGWA